MSANARLSRRQFGAAAAFGIGTALAATPSQSVAIGPLERNGRARFQYSLAAYSYRSLLQGDAPALTLFDFIDDCASFGLHGTELTSYYFQQPVTDDYLRKLRRHCFRQGINISGTAIRCDFGVPAGADREREIQDVKTWIDRAHVLGAPVIRIFAGSQPKEQTAEQTHELIVTGIQECCDYASQRGIHLALENHGGPTATAEGLLAICRDVQSDWFGVNLDTGNFHSDDVYGELEAAAPYAINVQIKVAVAGPDKQKRPADFARLADILIAAKYQGYVALEFEEQGDPRAESRKYLTELRQAFGDALAVGG